MIVCLSSQHLSPLLDRGSIQTGGSDQPRAWMSLDEWWWRRLLRSSISPTGRIHPSICPFLWVRRGGHCLCIPSPRTDLDDPFSPKLFPPSFQPSLPPVSPRAASLCLLQVRAQTTPSPHSLHHPARRLTPRPFAGHHPNPNRTPPLTPSPSPSPTHHVVTAPPLRGPARHRRNH